MIRAASKTAARPHWRPDPDAIDAIVAGRHGDPFAVLGMHQAEDGAVSVRVFWPGAATCNVVDARTGKQAAALEPVDAGLAKVTPNMLWASRSLGRGPVSTAWHVQLPIARGALLTAALLVFIDILKELPATLILRPFNFDTLAVIANNYALDERLEQASWPSLLIIALALPAVIWLTRKIARSRPGAA